MRSVNQNKQHASRTTASGSRFGFGSGILIVLILAVIGIVFRLLRQDNQVQNPASQQDPAQYAQTETPEERSDRLVLMNIINRFNLDDSVLPKVPSTAEELEERIAIIDQTADRLSQLNVQQSLKGAQQDVINLLTRWATYLRNQEETETLKKEFAATARQYPWLETLLWIIILNRL